MLFVAEYELSWDAMEPAMAKRLDWTEVQPEGFRFIGEYVWHDGSNHAGPFRGVAILEADDLEDLNAFILHYGPTLRLRIHPATDVISGIASTTEQLKQTRPKRKKQKATR